FFSATALGITLPACEKGAPMEEIIIDGDNPRAIKHRLRSAVKGGWKAEVWLYGSVEVPANPIPFTLRLTPEDKKTDKVPKVNIHLLIARPGGKPVREVTVEPKLLECARLKKHEEQTLIEDGRVGKTEQFRRGEVEKFPPPWPCWETTLS